MIRARTLEVVLRDIGLKNWRAQRIVEIERLVDITKTRSTVGDELSVYPATKDDYAEESYNYRMNSFRDQYRWASESVAELINQWKSVDFTESSLGPLSKIRIDLIRLTNSLQEQISQGETNETLRKWVTDTYSQRVRDLAEELRIRAVVSLEYEYSRRLSVELAGNKEAAQPNTSADAEKPRR